MKSKNRIVLAGLRSNLRMVVEELFLQKSV